jgi:hypothetical protein
MENEIRCMIIADGPELKVWQDPNPADKEVFEDRVKKLLCGFYTVEADGRCVIPPGVIDPIIKFGDRDAGGTRGGETCISTDRQIGDITVRVEVCKKHG